MFQIETHAHTPIISPCGVVPPEEMVRRYHEAGYAAITVTDHYRLDVFEKIGFSLDAYLEGWRRVKAEADKVGMKAYYGAELQFRENHNDYLLFGFSRELLADPERVCTMGLAAFSELARRDGALLIQAHPFRKGCVPVAPCLVDGIEAINRHDVHDNHNDRALALAEGYGLLKTSGGDFHDPEDRCIAGIASPCLPEDSRALAGLLRSGNFRLLGGEKGYDGKRI